MSATRGEPAGCPGCGLVLPDVDGPTHAYLGASPACWERYGRLLATEYSKPQRRGIHRLTVDAYAAQHPGVEEPRTVRSLATHLVALQLTLERDLDPEFVHRVMPLVTRANEVRWLDPPAPIQALTVLDVLGEQGTGASGPPAAEAEHLQRVRDRAGAVWSGWAPHHGTVRAWATSVLAQT